MTCTAPCTASAPHAILPAPHGCVSCPLIPPPCGTPHCACGAQAVHRVLWRTSFRGRSPRPGPSSTQPSRRHSRLSEPPAQGSGGRGIRFGKRWRGDASEALVALGLEPPGLDGGRLCPRLTTYRCSPLAPSACAVT